ncbi:unnamed protein product [Microthlaspi erraticum]|uniref:Uncharacterized protein n=1 Tax=Microthlaspi erraticum TaxID=1685480 RepID=A0A6D2J9X5_9BRAS|nr:unnamed protein product [Microthlaspi erraticum]
MLQQCQAFCHCERDQVDACTRIHQGIVKLKMPKCARESEFPLILHLWRTDEVNWLVRIKQNRLEDR